MEKWFIIIIDKKNAFLKKMGARLKKLSNGIVKRGGFMLYLNRFCRNKVYGLINFFSSSVRFLYLCIFYPLFF